MSTLTLTCSSSTDHFSSSGPSLTVSYFLWFWHKHKRDEQKHERPPKAWAQNRNSAVFVHTLRPKANPMAKSSVNEVGTLSPLVEVKGVDSCWKKSMDSKQGCNVTLNRPQAFIQIHYNPQAILLMWIAKWSIFNTSIWNLLTWKRIYSSEKKNPFESQVLQKKLTMVNEHAGVNCLSTVLIICALPIWTLQGFCRRHGFNPCLRKIPWRNKWQPTPVFLPGKFHRQRSLAGCCPWGRKELDMSEQVSSCYLISEISLKQILELDHPLSLASWH